MWFCDFVILKHLAYQYARRGACLVLVARKEKSIQEVADRARSLGSPEVLVIRADVSKVEVCKSFVDEAVEHFRRCEWSFCLYLFPSVFFFFF